MRNGLVAAVGMVLTALALSGCKIGELSSDPPEREEPEIGQLLVVTDLRTFALPLDPYIASQQNLKATTNAQNVLIQRCLSRFGFDYKIPPPSDPVVVGNERRYGVVDEQLASVWGYRVAPRPPKGPTDYVPPAGEMLAVIVGEGKSSISGQQVPKGGCAGEARRKLEESAPSVPNEQFAAGLAEEIASRLFEDSRVRKVTQSWSACMKRSGHDYSDPRKAINDPAFSGDTAGPQEINVAVTDIRCKRESNYINVIATVETAYQQRALERHASTLSAIKESFAAREKSAAAILAGS